jgi:hypothetical protein
VLDTPRAVRLVLWSNAALTGAVPLRRAVEAISGMDETHRYARAHLPRISAPGPRPEPPDISPEGHLARLLAHLADRGVSALRLALPVPGDPHGLPGPPSWNEEALAAGEGALTVPAHPAGPWSGLTPHITRFGSHLDATHTTVWRLAPVSPSPGAGAPGLALARRELSEGLLAVTRELTDLDLGRAGPDTLHRLSSLRDSGPEAGDLPPGTSPRATAVIVQALRLRALAALALRSDGAATTSHQILARTGSLRDLDRLARHALIAAVDAAIDGTQSPAPAAG